MNRYEREKPNTGGAQAAVNYARNTGQLSTAWMAVWWTNLARGEMRRALLGIDKKTAWCGDRDARLRRYILAARRYPTPNLPG
jgi:hypothetical protein